MGIKYSKLGEENAPPRIEEIDVSPYEFFCAIKKRLAGADRKVWKAKEGNCSLVKGQDGCLSLAVDTLDASRSFAQRLAVFTFASNGVLIAHTGILTVADALRIVSDVQ